MCLGAQVLCQHYSCLISCVDVQSLRVDQYGEVGSNRPDNLPLKPRLECARPQTGRLLGPQGSGHQRRVLLIYDGIHYDPLSCAPAGGGEVRNLAEAPANLGMV